MAPPPGDQRTREPRRMVLIGLTGNIASGKSTVMAILHEFGAATLDADQLVHQLMEPNTPVTKAVAAAFGPDILDERGAVHRQRLGTIVFRDPEALRRLEAIVHPAVGRAIETELKRWQATPTPPPALVLEAVKLVESGRYRMCDALWVVVADREVQRERLITRRGLSPAEADARLDAQPPLAQKLKLADEIIVNNGSLYALRRQVEEAWARTLANVT
ncbi:MAG: dephospho-CoA kinase [Ardenticatenia bacterium]|nr:dephospho-CoA kinase [Ardenticatenia bacterium]